MADPVNGSTRVERERRNVVERLHVIRNKIGHARGILLTIETSPARAAATLTEALGILADAIAELEELTQHR